jgi:uncharacterized protein with FMN-binding domain
MKRIGSGIIILAVFSCFNIYSAYPQVVPNASVTKETVVKTYDVNKDGKPDVTYYSDGKYVTRAQADTNYDGKPDVTVYTKNGKFESAEVDTDYDGKTEKKFTDATAFDKWLNEKHPDFKDKLNRPDWQVDLKKF